MTSFNLPEIDTRVAAETGVKVPLLRLDGEPLLNALKEPVGLVLLGADSKAYRAAQRRLNRTRIERAQKNRGKLATDEQLDEADREDMEALASVTTDWFGILDTDNKPVKFTREGVTKLYADYPVAREQAEAAVADRTRFIKPSSGG